MKVALYNPSNGADVIDFPISECVCDDEGNPVFDRDSQSNKTTGETYVWTIRKGEIVVFPKYVADYLCTTYGFLKRRKVSDKYLEADGKVPVENSDEQVETGI